MITLLAVFALQTASPATSTIAVEDAVAVTSVAPIRIKDGKIDGAVVIDVVGDARRAYRLQVQTTVTEASGQTHVVSDAGGEIGVDGATQTDAEGRDRLRIFGATALLRLGAAGNSVLPVRIVYE